MELDVPPVQLQWTDIKYSVKKAKKGCKKQEAKTINILQGLTGVVEPGNTLAIMGPSGSGKTTLMNIFACRIPKKHGGEVLVNGVKADLQIMRRIAGYVPQEDILTGSQTVREALLFYANLKNPTTITLKEKEKRVDKIIEELGLKKVAKSFIGYVGEDALNSGLRRGLSGGERKRLSIGLQLVSNPSLLFLDEPTTGLDSFTAQSIVQTLSNLAKQGRTVIFTIHQPSTEVMQLFDQLMIIGAGKTLYYGPGPQVVDYFKSIGYTCPKFENPGDYIMESVVVGKGEEFDGITKTKDSENVTAADEGKKKKKKKLKDGIDFSRATEQADKLSAQYNESEYVKYTQKAGEIPVKIDTGKRKDRPGTGLQMKMLLERSYKNVFREPNLLKAGLIQNTIVGILIGLIYLQLTYTQRGIQDRLGSIFFAATFMMFAGILGPFYLFPTERKIFLFQHVDGLYSTLTYYVAKLMAEIPNFLITNIIFGTIFYWMANLKPEAGAFFLFICISFLITNTAFAFGVGVIGLFPNPAVALNIFPLFFIPQMIFSGFYISANTVPPWFVWIEYVTFLKYSFAALAENEMEGAEFYCTDQELQDRGGVCVLTTGEAVLDFFGLDQIPIYANILVLIGFMLFFHTLAVILLVVSARKQKQV
jgi:ABC-type multidrug transport system ATPase subunit/ABC-type multidrug transport system permease subunit